MLGCGEFCVGFAWMTWHLMAPCHHLFLQRVGHADATFAHDQLRMTRCGNWSLSSVLLSSFILNDMSSSRLAWNVPAAAVHIVFELVLAIFVFNTCADTSALLRPESGRACVV